MARYTTKKVDYDINDFDGIDTINNSKKTGFNFQKSLINCFVVQEGKGDGIIKSRYGLKKLYTTPFSLSGTVYSPRCIDTVYFEDGSEVLITRIGDGWYKVKSDNSGLEALQTDGTGTATGRTLDAKKCKQSTFYNESTNKVFGCIADGGTLLKFDKDFNVSVLSSDADLSTSVLSVLCHSNRVWALSANKTQGSKVQDAFSSDSFSLGGNDAVEINHGEILPDYSNGLDLVAFQNNNIVICCETGNIIYQAPALFSNITKLSTSPSGCLTTGISFLIGTDVLVPNQDSINTTYAEAVYNNFAKTDETKYIRNIYGDYIEGCSDYDTISAGIFDTLRHYYISIPQSTGAKTLIYDIENQRFIGELSFSFVPTAWHYDKKNRRMYVGGNDGNIYYFDEDTYNDDDTAISYTWETQDIGTDLKKFYKIFKRFELLGDFDNTNEMTFTITGYGENGSKSATFTMQSSDTESTVMKKIFDLKGRSRWFRYKISWTSTNNRISILFASLQTTLGGERR